MNSPSQRTPSVIVLGGGGFIGTNLCRRLAASGARVRAFGRRCLFPAELGGAEWYQGDFTDAAALASAMETFDVVVHLVNNTTPQGANLDMAGDLQKNVVPSLALFDLCRHLGVSRLVFISSGGTVYGVPQQIPTPETAPTDPITAYGISKLAIEKYLALYEHLYGFDFRVLRVANPFGPYQIPIKSQGIIATLILRALRGESIEIWGDGSVVRDFIFIDDVVDALIAAANDSSTARTFNIGSGEGRSVRDVIASVENILEKKLSMRWQQARPVDIPTSTLAIERASRIMGWKPKTKFEDGLTRTIRWWQHREHQ
jgi:UDP-glucose 4-epimerase